MIPETKLEWKGEAFIDRDDVAAEAGRQPKTVDYHLRVNGNLDTLGTGSDWAKRREHPDATPVSIAGQRFPSVRALSRACNKRLRTVQRWLGKKEFDKIEAALAAAQEGET